MWLLYTIFLTCHLHRHPQLPSYLLSFIRPSLWCSILTVACGAMDTLWVEVEQIREGCTCIVGDGSTNVVKIWILPLFFSMNVAAHYCDYRSARRLAFCLPRSPLPPKPACCPPASQIANSILTHNLVTKVSHR